MSSLAFLFIYSIRVFENPFSFIVVVRCQVWSTSKQFLLMLHCTDSWLWLWLVQARIQQSMSMRSCNCKEGSFTNFLGNDDLTVFLFQWMEIIVWLVVQISQLSYGTHIWVQWSSHTPAMDTRFLMLTVQLITHSSVHAAWTKQFSCGTLLLEKLFANIGDTLVCASGLHVTSLRLLQFKVKEFLYYVWTINGRHSCPFLVSEPAEGVSPRYEVAKCLLNGAL